MSNVQSKIVILSSGGIAAYKIPDLHRLLLEAGAQTRAVMTANAHHFVTKASLEAASGAPVFGTLFDESTTGSISHVELGQWADLVIVAPATADILARMAHGLADDAATTFLLACRAPLLVAPGMNDAMWEHPATKANCETLRTRGVHFVGPEHGALAEGYEALGRMSEAAAIRDAALDLLP